MFFDVLSQRALLLCLVLSVFVSIAYLTRIVYRRDVRYDAVSEWCGHGLHGPGMAYMSAVMLGWIPAVIPFAPLAVVYTICTAVFVVRMIFGFYYIWWWDLLHVVGSASMAYMFWHTSMWSPYWTLIFIAYYVAVIAIYVHYVREHVAVQVPRARFAHLLSDYSHHAMAVSMIIMLTMMQWPTLIGSMDAFCVDGHAPTHHGHRH